MPERIQRRRTKGWRRPEGTTYVGRRSGHGNQWSVWQYHDGWYVSHVHHGEHHGPYGTEVYAARVAVDLFRIDAGERFRTDPAGFEAWIAPLRGRDLSCWCDLDEPCHADVLLELANGDRSP